MINLTLIHVIINPFLSLMNWYAGQRKKFAFWAAGVALFITIKHYLRVLVPINLILQFTTGCTPLNVSFLQ